MIDEAVDEMSAIGPMEGRDQGEDALSSESPRYNSKARAKTNTGVLRCAQDENFRRLCGIGADAVLPVGGDEPDRADEYYGFDTEVEAVEDLFEAGVGIE
jgi:hypothetical protein